ncbi:hypothetical protein ACZ87_02437 [Candidatus Erwinia dacicola]|uniref:Uncharacterized protein n=1 Tax=Candidatus Erwinia dacicola TaxID=252393 RepID=A0A328TKX6_9GAMM|nr:hypothetical protein ACZ87_02437 [Candidatus Erwinia dacicola]
MTSQWPIKRYATGYKKASLMSSPIRYELAIGTSENANHSPI